MKEKETEQSHLISIHTERHRRISLQSVFRLTNARVFVCIYVCYLQHSNNILVLVHAFRVPHKNQVIRQTVMMSSVHQVSELPLSFSSMNELQ